MRGKVLTFYLCGSLYGLDIKLVKEIVRHAEYTPIPDAPEYIVGLMNMRGQIVTLFNLAKLMNHPQLNDSGSPTCIILKNTPDEPDYVGLLIDRAGSVLDIEEDNCEPSPANMNHSLHEYVSEVVKLKNQLLMVINPQFIYQL
jgi:purine-binding chemotaxis protein CheW